MEISSHRAILTVRSGQVGEEDPLRSFSFHFIHSYYPLTIAHLQPIPFHHLDQILHILLSSTDYPIQLPASPQHGSLSFKPNKYVAELFRTFPFISYCLSLLATPPHFFARRDFPRIVLFCPSRSGTLFRFRLAFGFSGSLSLDRNLGWSHLPLALARVPILAGKINNLALNISHLSILYTGECVVSRLTFKVFC